MTEREALRLALEALEESHPEAYRHTITVIKQALAQHVATDDTLQERVDETAKQRHEPEHEPVVWGVPPSREVDA